MRPTLFILIICFLISYSVSAQINDSPAGAYTWKKGKTEMQSGYVVLKSGKRLEGKISLHGSSSAVNEIEFEGDGKELKFPAASLKSYGLTNVNPNASTSTAAAAVNDSPESMYEWRNMGVVMGKVIQSTQPRAGYVILRNGQRLEGELKLRKKDNVLEDIEIKTPTGKEKFDVPEVAHYGYTVSEAEVVQAKLARESKDNYPGSILTSNGVLTGEVALFRGQGQRYLERITFKGADGQYAEYNPKTISGFTYLNKGKTYTYTVVDGKFVSELFLGKTFQVYRNPNPTTINEFATSMAKGLMQVGTTAAATAAVKKDQEKNNYVSNMDSILRVSTTEQLIDLRDKLTAVSGYNSVQEALDNSDNESLKTNLSALELTIQGRQASTTPGGILNDEWIILNKVTNEKTVVYKSKYKDQIDVLLMGCDKYLELSKPAQNDLQKWDGLAAAAKLLDSCY